MWVIWAFAVFVPCLCGDFLVFDRLMVAGEGGGWWGGGGLMGDGGMVEG